MRATMKTLFTYLAIAVLTLAVGIVVFGDLGAAITRQTEKTADTIRSASFR